jgi:hypothetical protein
VRQINPYKTRSLIYYYPQSHFKTTFIHSKCLFIMDISLTWHQKFMIHAVDILLIFISYCPVDARLHHQFESGRSVITYNSIRARKCHLATPTGLFSFYTSDLTLKSKKVKTSLSCLHNSYNNMLLY